MTTWWKIDSWSEKIAPVDVASESTQWVTVREEEAGVVRPSRHLKVSEHEWWVLACQRIGGTWRNAAQPAKLVSDELRQMEENRGFRAERVVHLTGGNDLVLGLAPGIRGQIARRVERFREGVGALRMAAPNVTVILQPLDLSGAHPTLQTAGHEADLARAYAEMARAADVDLSQLPVDFLDVLHFGDRGHRLLADRIVEVLRER